MASIVAVCLDDEIVAAMDRVAERMDCRRTEVLARAVKDFLADDSWILAGLAAGRSVEAEAILALAPYAGRA